MFHTELPPSECEHPTPQGPPKCVWDKGEPLGKVRPTQSIMYVPLQENRYQKSVLLILQYKYLKSCSRDFYSPESSNLILRTRSCDTGFITQYSWFFHFPLTTLVRWKCFVPQLYQFRRGISGGPALNFYVIHRGGRTAIVTPVADQFSDHFPRLTFLKVSSRTRFQVLLYLISNWHYFVFVEWIHFSPN